MKATFPKYDNFPYSVHNDSFFLNIKIYCCNQVLIIPCGYRNIKSSSNYLTYLFEKINPLWYAFLPSVSLTILRDLP